MRQEVDTEKLRGVIMALQRTDGELTRAMGELRGKAHDMESGWHSGAGELALRAMYQILQASDARSTVLQNYIRFLERTAIPGLSDAETTNAKLAAQFK